MFAHQVFRSGEQRAQKRRDLTHGPCVACPLRLPKLRFCKRLDSLYANENRLRPAITRRATSGCGGLICLYQLSSTPRFSPCAQKSSCTKGTPGLAIPVGRVPGGAKFGICVTSMTRSI